MVKRGRKHFDDAFGQHPPETREPPPRLYVRAARAERLAGRRLRADSCETRQCGIPYLYDEICVRRENAD